MIEILQILKFSYYQDHLQFEDPDDFVKEEDLYYLQLLDEQLADIDPIEIQSLLKEGRIKELAALLSE